MKSVKQEWKKLAAIIVVFLACFYLPVGAVRFDSAVSESLHLVRWYAREHVVLCLVPVSSLLAFSWAGRGRATTGSFPPSGSTQPSVETRSRPFGESKAFAAAPLHFKTSRREDFNVSEPYFITSSP
jgi:hypothetical protein